MIEIHSSGRGHRGQHLVGDLCTGRRRNIGYPNCLWVTHTRRLLPLLKGEEQSQPKPAGSCRLQSSTGIEEIASACGTWRYAFASSLLSAFRHQPATRRGGHRACCADASDGNEREPCEVQKFSRGQIFLSPSSFGYAGSSNIACQLMFPTPCVSRYRAPPKHCIIVSCEPRLRREGHDSRA